MIQLQELRVGNYISDLDGKIIKVEELTICASYTTKKRINNLPFDYYKPIPLTEELLLKFGFEYRKKNSKVIMLGLTKEEYETTLQNWITTNFFQISRCGINALSVEVKYVHQLQNLFFSLCGEELKFEDIS